MDKQLKQAECRIMELEQANKSLMKRNAKAYGTIKELKADVKKMQAAVVTADTDAERIRHKGRTLYAYVKWMIDRLHRLEGLEGQTLNEYERGIEKEYNEMVAERTPE